MDAVDVIKRISNHVIVKSSMSMQMQLGLPYLCKKNNKLCMCLKPHKEVYKEGYIEFYPQQYILELVYPFEQVIHFQNIMFETKINVSEPIIRLSANKMIGAGSYLIGELYQECSRVLDEMKKNGCVSDLSLEYYRKAYYNTINHLGLTSSYGSDLI